MAGARIISVSTVQYSPDLYSGHWSNLPGGHVFGTGYDAIIADTNSLNQVGQRFYRLLQTE